MMKTSCIPSVSTLLAVLVLTAGCGHVAGNYPVRSQPKPDLPLERHANDGQEMPLVWQLPGRVHGFLFRFKSTAERAALFRDYANRMNLAHLRRSAETYEELARDGLAEVCLQIYFGKDVSLPCEGPEFEFTFADGTVDRSVAVSRAEPRDANNPFRSTRDGRITLSEEPVGRRNPLWINVYIPGENLGKEIAKIVYLQRG